jgi:N utilization substance protein A
MNKDLVAIFEYLEREKGIKREIVVEAIRESLEIAAQKCVQDAQNIEVTIHPRTGEIEILCDKQVVEKVLNPATQIQRKEALQFYPDCEIGQAVHVVATPKEFGRIAAQKARQVIAQKLRGAERDVIQEEYRHRVNTLVSGTVKRISKNDTVIVDLGKVDGVMPRRGYLPQESFSVGHKVLAILSEVRDTESGGAEVVLSRTCPEFVIALLNQEVPEVSDDTVAVEKLVREPGYRTKMIVRSSDAKVDPVGACIGVRGARVKNIIRELCGEKLDVIPYQSQLDAQLSAALNPVVARKMDVSENGTSVSIVVDDDDFPTTIGKKGMNVRLLAQLLGIQLTVQKMSDYVKLKAIERASLATSEDETLDLPLTSIEGVPSMIVDQLVAEGFSTTRQLLLAEPEQIAKVAGISIEMADKILEQIRKQRS